MASKDSPDFEELQKDIRALLHSAQQGLTPSELEQDYRIMLGKQMPYTKYGYDSVLSLVKDLPKVVIPVFRPGGELYLRAKSDATSRHIEKLVRNQKKSSKASRIRPIAGAPPPRPMVPYSTRVKIKELMKCYPGGISASLFGKAYSKRFGEELDYKALGYGEWKGFLRGCSDILTLYAKKKDVTVYLKDNLEDQSTAKYLKADSHLGTTKSSNSSSTAKRTISSTRSSMEEVDSYNRSHKSSSSKYPNEESYPSNFSLEDIDGVTYMPKNTECRTGGITGVRVGISDKLQREIRQIMESKPNGVWSARLPFEYKNMYKKLLDVQEVGFRSVIELAGSLPHIIRIERPAPDSDWLLFPADLEIYNNQLLPKSAAGSDDSYKEKSFQVEEETVLKVVHVLDPDNFWFRPDSWEKEHNDMMKKLQEFYYSADAQKFTFPDSFRRPGQVCCAIFEDDGHWYRAKVLSMTSANTTEVLYVDYGNQAVVPKANVRLLMKEFLSFPIHAIKGKLAGIKCSNKRGWRDDAIDYFYELTSDRRLFGKYKGISDDVIKLEIIDTNSDQDIYVNSVMVVKGFAVYDKVEPTKQKVATKPPPGIGAVSTAGNVGANVGANVFLPTTNAMHVNSVNYMQAYYMYSLAQMQVQLSQMQSAMLIGQPLMQAATMPTMIPQQEPLQPAVPEHVPEVSKSKVQNVPSEEEPEAIEVGDSHLEEFGNQDKPDVVPQEQMVVGTSDEDYDQVFEEEIRERHDVKRLYLPNDVIIHVINYDSVAYVHGAEISALFWHGNYLRAMLRQKNATYPKVTIKRDECGDLFDEMERFDVPGLTERNKPKEVATLYEFESVPDILALFNHKSDVLKIGIAGQVERCKKHWGKFWETSECEVDPEQEEEDSETNTSSEEVEEQEEDEEDDEEVESDSEDLELELEELKLLEQAMHFKRKRLFNALMSGKSTQEKVDALKAVENELDAIRAKIKTKSGKS